MKQIFIVILFLISTSVFSQTTEAIGGVESHINPRDYSRTFHPVFSLNTFFPISEGINLGAITTVVVGDSIPDLYYGFKASVPYIWVSKNKKNAFGLSANVVMGTKGKLRFGGSLDYIVSPTVSVSLNGGQIYNERLAYLGLTGSYTLMP